MQSIDVTPGEIINISIGSGGSGTIVFSPVTSGDDGGNTIVQCNGIEIVANGGKGGGNKTNVGEIGGNGGSGGGGGFVSTFSEFAGSSWYHAGNGGSDGGNGFTTITNSPFGTRCGRGQGTTTRAFGESNGTLYAGGGGGYGNGGGTGGEGGGGNAGCDGAANTGGGGGGNLGNGGSGTTIIRWGY